jgi:hypothetical protein
MNTSVPMKKSSKHLPEKAIRLMNTWYMNHQDNPYPNRHDLDYLSQHGEIKESQVKAWFSNKRNRTQNTHPKRAKRYLVRHRTSTCREPTKCYLADQWEQRSVVLMQPTSYVNDHSLPCVTHVDCPWASANAYEYSC